MRSENFFVRLTAVLATFTLTLLAAVTPATAQQETILHSFPSSAKDGVGPTGNLIFDAAGNLYGTAYLGGSSTACPSLPGCGIVFELTPAAGGGWTEKILHQFNYTGGAEPQGLILDPAGNLYGVALGGGSTQAGIVYELTPSTNGTWAEKVLHTFNTTTEGYPEPGLVLDAAGNLYGTAGAGGEYGYGIVFELTHSASGYWTAKTLHNFNKNGFDGYNANGPLVMDAAGNLYGTTYYGGVYGAGTAFELQHSSGGGWTEVNLHNFNNNGNTDGYYPQDGLVFDTAGNLYGTTSVGGTYSFGTVFEVSPVSGGKWHETVLHNFSATAGDGGLPSDGLFVDAAGNLYGTTSYGGAYLYWGTAFEMSPTSDGTWNETVLHSFGSGTDGSLPVGSVILDGAGNVYGTTYRGGTYGTSESGGTVFEVTP
jgi:uncharacterized repeat protein (TIGR03803 family)